MRKLFIFLVLFFALFSVPFFAPDSVEAGTYCVCACGVQCCTSNQPNNCYTCNTGPVYCPLNEYEVYQCGETETCSQVPCDDTGLGWDCCVNVCDPPPPPPPPPPEDDGDDDGGGGDPPPPPPPPAESHTISGTVYQGTGILSGGVCTGAGTAFQPGAGSVVDISGTDVPVNGSGVYGVSVNDGLRVLTLEGMDPEWVCTCPIGCQYSVNLTSNTVRDFYVVDQQLAWWQSRGGDVAGNTGSVNSNIPVTCTGGVCFPYMSLRDALSTSDSSGVVTHTGGAGFGSGGSVAEDVNYVAESQYRAGTKKEGYNYFFRLFEMGLNPVDDFSDPLNVAKPLVGPTNSRAYFSDESIVINTPWDLDPGESMVIFVDGNIRIESTIVTSPGEFVAFIASGDIIFDAALGSATVTNTVADVEGVFVADGLITTEASALKFVGEGTFVGWSGMSLNRDFGTNDNNLNPAELFTYRPDFLLNTPAEMKKPVIRWEEIAP